MPRGRILTFGPRTPRYKPRRQTWMDRNEGGVYVGTGIGGFALGGLLSRHLKAKKRARKKRLEKSTEALNFGYPIITNKY